VYPHQRDRLRAVLSSHGLAALVTTVPLNIAWATSTSPQRGPAPRALVATPSGSVLLARDDDPDADSLNADDVGRYGAGHVATIGDALAATVAALHVGADDPVALEIDPERTLDEPPLRAALGARDVRPGRELWRRARAVKSPFELECLERGLITLEEALNAAIQVLAPGMTAQQTVEICEKEAGRRGMAFDRALIEAVRGGRRRAFRAGDVLRLELSGVWKGYHAQVARVAVLGKPDAGQEQRHATLEGALAAAVRAMAPGVPASAVYAAAAGTRGLHVTGGGIGLEPAELPGIGPDEEEPLEPGAVLTVAVAAETGVRLVDTVLLTSHSHRRLNRSHAGLVSLD
jgi:Xaa-Pro aminopeptidase